MVKAYFFNYICFNKTIKNMRKIVYLFIAVITISLASCGGNSNENDNQKVESTVLKGYEELNLSEWGFNLLIMVPKSDVYGKPEVTLTESGALQIFVGIDFGIEIMYGDADIELLKQDLKEDLVFTTDIVKEEENALVYAQNIPDAGVKTQNHFLYRANVDGEVFEVRDVVGNEYLSGMIEKMLEAAKTIKSSNK